jgi:hypothetical protein
MSEDEARQECMKIFAGDKADRSSAERVNLTIQKLKGLGVWPW